MKKSELKKLERMGVKLSDALPTYDVPIDLIEPNPSNPNEMDDMTFDRLVEEMEKTGIVSPIQIAPVKGDKFQIVGGEHRWRGAKALGHETIPCTILMDEQFMDQELRDFLVVRLNAIKGDVNPEKFQRMYQEKVEVYGADKLKILFGYTSTDAWKKLTKGVENALRGSSIGGGRGNELATELGKRAKKIKTVDGLAAALRDIMKQHSGDLKTGFMLFSYGGKKHFHLVMTEELEAAMTSLSERCRDREENLSGKLAEIVQKWIKEDTN